MPCNPLDNNLNPHPAPPIPIPGFGLPFAPIQLPVPGFSLPEGFPEDLLDFINNLTLPWPGGDFSPQVDDLANTLLKYLSDIFGQIAPFLSLYNFFMALLNMVLCIIEVLCAIPNAWSMIRAVRRLIKRCLPPFLNLFPWLALLAMILALLMLLLALIEYIIARILQIIEDLLRNLQLLAAGVTLQDAESTAATAFKIASLLCLIEQLMAVFSAVAAIFAIIEALANIRGRTVCSKSGGSNDVQCCGDDVCPPFIADNQDGIDGIQGRLVYYKQITANPIAGDFFVRPESWQFVNDADPQEYPFKSIITQYSASYGSYGGDGGSRSQSSSYDKGDIFWPEGVSFANDTTLRRAPYTVDLTLKGYDPSVFVDSDIGGPRDIVVKNAIVTIKPYVGVRDEDNNLDTTDNDEGTLSLVGGTVWEADGTTPLTISGTQATIETLIHSPASSSGTAPTTDDSTTIESIEFVLNINHASLVNYNLLTLGCIPDIRKELDLSGAIYNPKIDPVIVQTPNFLPDISGAQSCVANILAELRKDVSIENTEAARDQMIVCLETLRDETTEAFCSVFEAAVDPFQSTIAIDPDVQFVTRPISVAVVLKDIGGVDISRQIPAGCQDGIEDNLRGIVTLGEISDFEWDGYTGKFMAEITSTEGGDGELQVSWKNNIFSEILNQDDVDADTEIQEVVVPYTFVGTDSGRDAQSRRTAVDVANSIGEK